MGCMPDQGFTDCRRPGWAICLVLLLMVPASRLQAQDALCMNSRELTMHIAIKGLSPQISMIGQYGEEYLIFRNPQTNEWMVTRRLFMQEIACLMAAGKSFTVLGSQ